MACRIHKSVLGYMGDKTMSFPATLAQDILQKGLEIPELVDEIYMQTMKQLTNNPKPESIARGWQLMCMCVGTFPPSREFENHLLNYVLEKRDSTGAVGNYARYSLRRLEGMLSSGASGFVPSVEEIQSYKERPPILATIELVDGTPLTEELPVTPDLNVAKVLEICTHFLDLQDLRAGPFGVFVVDVKVLALRSSVISEEPETLQQEYVSAVQHHELFGTHFFHVKKVNDVEAISTLPTSMIAAFNSDGLHFCDENRRILMSYGYADIYRWGGSSVQFSLIIWNADTQDTFEMILTTFQAADMAALILDFINAIMAATSS